MAQIQDLVAENLKQRLSIPDLNFKNQWSEKYQTVNHQTGSSKPTKVVKDYYSDAVMSPKVP